MNLYHRLITATSGTAFQIVENVALHNGVEAWRLLNFQFDPKTDARLTTLVLTTIGYKIKGKDIQAGLVLWEAQMLALERDHQETLSSKIKRAVLMDVLPTSVQPRVMEHLDRLNVQRGTRKGHRALPFRRRRGHRQGGQWWFGRRLVGRLVAG